MAERNLRIVVFEVCRTSGDRIMVTKCKFHFQKWFHLFKQAKQPLPLYVPALVNHVNMNMGELDRRREFRITLSKAELRCYYNPEKNKFMFKGFILESEYQILNKHIQAETKLKETIEKRKATRKANKAKKEQNWALADDDQLLEQVRELFVVQNPQN